MRAWWQQESTHNPTGASAGEHSLALILLAAAAIPALVALVFSAVALLYRIGIVGGAL